MKQRIITLILALSVLCGMLVGLAPNARALHLWIKDRSAVSGSDYTDSDIMAQKLDEIFDGSLSVYSNSGCTKPVSAPIGSSVMKNNGVAMYVGPYGGTAVNSGTSCWIYAQGVYYTLFQDYVLNNKSKTGNSENVDMSTTATKNCTYENFKAWGVRQGVGAMLRASGHSMILLGYDEEKMITLEGNADSAGLVCIRERSWDILETKYASFTFIVQPKDTYMQEHYDACRHESMSELGVCPECGYTFNWKRTLDSTAAGYYEVTATCTPKAEQPYSAAENAASLLATGELVQVQGSVTNYFGETWYKLALEDGTVVYVPAELLEFSHVLPLEVTCTGFKPADGLALPAASYPLGGTVTSNYPLKRIDGYLDGVWYAAWNASNNSTTQMTLGSTDINMDLSFSKLAEGKHTIKLVATDYVHTESVTFHTSVFYIVGDDECLHTYSDSLTTAPSCEEAGVRTFTCSQCGDSYTETVAALGHSYSNGYCTACGALDMDYTFKTANVQVGTAEAVAGQTVSVPVTIAENQCFAKFTFTVSYDSNMMSLTGASAGALLENGSMSCSGNTVSWSSATNTAGDGMLLYLNFELAQTTPGGSYEISLALKGNSTWYFRDENNYARDVAFGAGSIRCLETAPVSVYEGTTKLGDYANFGQALDNYDSTCQYLKLSADLTAASSLTQDLYLDLNGFSLSGTLQTNGWAVYGMDSASDGYTADSVGYFSCTENDQPVVPQPLVRIDQKRYAALEQKEGYSFHRFYMGITHATVKPASEGVGYKALFAADPVLAQQIDSFGFILQLGDHTPMTVRKTELVSGQPVTLRIEHYDAVSFGETELNVRVFVSVNGQQVESAVCSYSLRQILELLNANAAALDDAQKTALAAWIADNPVMQTWNTQNLY